MTIALDWKTWCRLCGSYEFTDRIDPEIEQIIQQLFSVTSKNAFVCLDCSSYLKDFLRFSSKARSVSQMFDQLERETSKKTVLLDQELAFSLQLRRSYNLPVFDFHIEESLPIEDIASIEQLESEVVGEDLYDAEYLFDDEETVEAAEQEEIVANDTPEDQPEESKAIVPFLGPAVDEYTSDNNYDFQENEIDGDDTLPTTLPSLVESIESRTDDEKDMSQHYIYKCHVCDEELSQMSLLAVHTKSHHDCLPQVECVCDKTITSMKSLQLHYQIHFKRTDFRCYECDMNFQQKNQFQTHMSDYHHIGDDDLVLKRLFQCSVCDKSFKQARHLATHQLTHLPADQKFVHQCSFCEKRYSSIFTLRQHIKAVHVKDLTIKCPHCDKMFARKANLDSHISHVHTTSLNFECDICHLRVKTKGILRCHKKLHSSNPDDFYNCQFCDRQFKTSNQLTNHMICHSNNKKYKCQHCSAEYKRSKDLICHTASVHTREAKYVCDLCSKVFYNNSNYRKHKLKIHSKEMMEVDVTCE